MLLMIDNYDSFTYNLVQYLGELGADVRVFRNDQITLQEIEDLKPAKIVISPGPCTPNEAGVSIDTIKQFAGYVPILGVFNGLPNPFEATRYHSLVIEQASLPECLEVTAWTTTENGELDEIMGVRHKTLMVEGVQFHPESILTGCGHDLLRNFLRMT
jgi:anthranilate synthase component 2